MNQNSNYGSQGLRYKINPDGQTCEITGMGECMDKAVIIPQKIGGYTVTSIGKKAFRYCRRFKHMILPDSVLTIDEYAFSECKTLESVTLGNAVTSIGKGAFGNCSSLASLTLPSSVTSIGKRAFMGVGEVRASEKNPRFITIDGNLFSSDGRTFLHYATGKKDTSFTVPSFVTEIGEMAFYLCKNLTEIIIPNSVKSIAEYAFCGCTGVSALTVPDSVADIGEGAFSGLGEVSVSKDHAYYVRIGCALYTKDMKTLLHCAATIKDSLFSVPDTVTRIGNGAFHACNHLKIVTLGTQVTDVGDYAFWTCKGLEEIHLGNAVASIGKCAFRSCQRLRNLMLPASLSFIGADAFFFCRDLTSVRYLGAKNQWKKVHLEDIRWRNESSIRSLLCTDGTIEYLF